MARRIASDTRANSHNEITGSIFEPEWNPKLPKGIPAELRRNVKATLEHNRHLRSDDQLESVLRLCKLRVLLEKAEDDLHRVGMTVVNRNGEEVPNPMLKTIASLSSSVLAHERSLGVVFVSKGAQVKKAEKTPNSAPPAQRPTPAGRPKLKLA